MNYPFCPKLAMWYFEAYSELSISKKTIDHSYAIYPKRFYKNIKLNINKKYDFIFIGQLDHRYEGGWVRGGESDGTYNKRKWIIPFINNKFNSNSYLQFTDKNTKQNYKIMGNYDHTLSEKGFAPKECGVGVKHAEMNFFDKKYFDKMSQSKFGLCPAGDSIYSMRFYECLMCKCIPIVSTDEETYRSKEESKLNYKYYLASNSEFVYREDWVEHNYNIFLQYHTLEHLKPNLTIQEFNPHEEQDNFILNMLKNKKNGFFLEIGSDHPINDNKLYILEKKYGWNGIILEPSNKRLNFYKKTRPNSIHIIDDATKIDYKSLFEINKVPINLDYLKIDLQLWNGCTIATLEKLNSEVMDKHKFATIIFEHDNWNRWYRKRRLVSRKIFEDRGYVKVCSEVPVRLGLCAEDWYIHPDLVDSELMNTFIQSLSF